MPRFAANISFLFTELAFLDRFKAAADAGFRAVEVLFPYDFTPEAIAKALDSNGLELVLFNLPPGNWEAGERGLAALPDRWTEFKAGVEQALPYLAATGARHVHMLAGIAEPADPLAQGAYEKALLHAADRLEQHGVSVLIEPINRRDMPGYFLHDFSVARALLERLDHPFIGLQFDIYHHQIIHGEALDGFRAALPFIRHMQVAAAPARDEPDGTMFRSLFAAIDAAGYRGFIGCEYRPRNGTMAGLDWLRALGNQSQDCAM